MWTWDQSAGTIAKDGDVIGHGYSGADYGKNNPDKETVPGIGPIPHGDWHIVSVKDSANTGPFTIVLAPAKGTNTFGRSEFRIHGDSIANPGKASHGCIILPRIIRQEIWRSNDRLLRVVK